MDEMIIDLPKLKSLLFGDAAFYCCSHVVFASESCGVGVMNRLA